MTIARHARDFVHSRTVKEVFPPLLQFLTNLQTLVMDRDRRHTLAATQAIRILTRLCSGVWDLLELLDLHPLESDPIIQVLIDEIHRKVVIGVNTCSWCWTSWGPASLFMTTPEYLTLSEMRETGDSNWRMSAVKSLSSPREMLTKIFFG